MTTRFLFLGVASLLALGVTNHSVAQTCEQVAGRISSAQGRISIQRADGGDWQRAALRTTVCQGDTVRAGLRSRAAVNLNNQTVLRLDQSSTIRMDEISPREEVSSLLRLFSGVVQFFSRKPRTYKIATTTSTIGIRGTEFVVSVREDETTATVFEGALQASNESGEVAVESGQTVTVAQGRAPEVRTQVRPRDQVQWSLFYPPVVALSGTSAFSGNTDGSVGRALDCARLGDTECAFDALDTVPESGRGAAYLLLRGALLLAVGRVQEASDAIDRALSIEAQASGPLALRAVIAVVQNDVPGALETARRAVAASPDAAAPRIALSYAQQANLELVPARDTLLQAVQRQPQNALAWARLAELWLALGFRGEAATAAERAVEIDPNVARTQLVQGFAALARIDTAGATSAFERALQLESADPLAHLGLGLARIREGDLAPGRAHIETAVALDSNNALLRPYLGRAYYEERRAPLDTEQYAIAKDLDPLDPTAFLFDAIRKQSENRPVEALADLEQSIANNDNRAVYRGRVNLDGDRAARGVSLARVHDALGFSQLGLNESRRSLILDPSNASAHRFLADTYSNVRRREISRVSELMQAQMLQDINTNPVQPSLSSSNLNVVGGGPADVGLNEFTPLFESDGLQLGATLLGGNNDTSGGEVVVSALYDRFSISLGGYTYETDGWRDNNFQEQDIGNLFLQAAITPELNAQLELTDRSTEEGDLAFNFDPEVFAQDRTVERDLETGRVGFRWSPGPANDFLVSHIESDRETLTEEDQMVFLEDPPGPGLFPAFLEGTIEEDGSQSEVQYIRRGRSYNLVIGASTAEVDVETADSTQVDLGGPFPPITLFDVTAERKIEQTRPYVYANFLLGDYVTLTAGVSHDDYEDEPHDESDDNVKLGVQWRIDDRHTLRAAAFETVKPALVNNRTLEPTNVSGFNQFFDDINGTKSETIGLGYDSMPSATVSWGIELTQRDLEEPQVESIFDPMTFELTNTSVFEDREERLARIYLYWTPSPSVAVSIEAVQDEYEADEGVATMFASLPTEVTTTSLPINVRYYSPSGWFVGIGATAVDQEVEVAPFDGFGTTVTREDDNFTVVDLTGGYRLPKRRGVITVDIRNVGDEEFSFQDDTFREFRDEPSIGPYFPETTGIVRATFSF